MYVCIVGTFSPSAPSTIIIISHNINRDLFWYYGFFVWHFFVHIQAVLFFARRKREECHEECKACVKWLIIHSFCIYSNESHASTARAHHTHVPNRQRKYLFSIIIPIRLSRLLLFIYLFTIRRLFTITEWNKWHFFYSFIRFKCLQNRTIVYQLTHCGFLILRRRKK